MKLTIVTWNRGNGTRRDLRRVLRRLRPDVLALQEFSDAPQSMRRLLRRRGYQEVVTHRPGGAATPIWVRRGLAILATRFTLAAEAGDGPDIHKDKFICEARVYDPQSGALFAVRNLHLPFHQGNPEQRQAAARMIRLAFDAPLDIHDACFVVGDFNRSPHNVPAPDRWECSQVEHPMPTHGPGWSPDQQWRIHARRVVGVRRSSSRVLDGTRSDHRPYACTYAIWEV